MTFSSLRLLFYYLWIVPHVLQVVILILLFKRNLYTKFPIFTTYTAFTLLKFAALFLISQSLKAQTEYFKWYSLALGVYVALEFGVVYEIFAHVFENHAALRNAGQPIFRWTTITLLLAAFSFAAYTHPSIADSAWFSVHVLERSANIVLCGLILTIFWFSYYLGLSWTRLAFGIAMGLGVLCSFELAFAALRSEIGLHGHQVIDLIDMGIYHCCVLIWLFYLLTPERRPQHIPDSVPDNNLEAWNNELESLLTR